MQGSLGKKIRLTEFGFVWNNSNYIPLNSKISVKSLSTVVMVLGYFPRKGQTRMNREGLTRRLQSCNARFSIVAMLEGENEGQLRGAASSPELRGFSDSHGLYCPDNRTFPPAMCRPVPAVPPPAAAPSSSQHRRAALAPLGRGRTRGTVRGHPGTPRVTPHCVRTAAPPRERPRR